MKTQELIYGLATSLVLQGVSPVVYLFHRIIQSLFKSTSLGRDRKPAIDDALVILADYFKYTKC